MKNYDEFFIKKWRKDKIYRISLYILGFGGVLIGLLFITNVIFYQTKGKSLRTETYESFFNGEVTHISTTKGVTLVKIKNKDEKIFLKYSYNHNTKPNRLDKFLRIGDIIEKNSFSDSLIVKRDNIEYVFILGYIPPVRKDLNH